MMRSASSFSAGSITSTSPQSPRRCPKPVSPTRVSGPTLASARRMLSRTSASLFCRDPSIWPHIEPEPSSTIITDGGSAALPAPVQTAAISMASSTVRTGPCLPLTLASAPSWFRNHPSVTIEPFAWLRARYPSNVSIYIAASKCRSSSACDCQVRSDLGQAQANFAIRTLVAALYSPQSWFSECFGTFDLRASRAPPWARKPSTCC